MSALDTAALRQGQIKNLVLATWAFAISFWAWNLIGPLAVTYAEAMSLSAGQKSLIIATPVLVGSVGRVLVGTLTDRFGGRVMFPALLLISVPFVLLVSVAGNADSFGQLLVWGFFLGIAGTSFAAGIPFVNAWFEPSRRGFATGVFGAGMGGTALSAFFTSRFVDWFGYTQTHLIMAVALVVTAVVCWVGMRDAPGWSPNRARVLPRFSAALHLPVTWQMMFLYAVAFGGFVAFSTYLPTYLQEVYGFDLAGAGARTAGFAVAAVVSRPIGGVVSDRIGPKKVMTVSLVGAAVLSAVVALEPPAEAAAGVVFVVLAIFLGLGTGAVFAWIALLAPADQVGTVTGLVGAAGGLGGYFPPLVMAATVGMIGSHYALGLLLLTVVALCALGLTLALEDKRKPA